jgi:hypothetical protein
MCAPDELCHLFFYNCGCGLMIECKNRVDVNISSVIFSYMHFAHLHATSMGSVYYALI